MVKAIFFDIDGTLVSFNTHKVPQSTIEALEVLRSKGIKVIIATGRQFEAINNLGNLKFDGYITMNGSYCFIDKNEVIFKHHIPKHDIEALIHYVNDIEPFPCFFVTENESFGNYYDKNANKIFTQLNFPAPEIRPLEDALKYDVFQVLSFHNIKDEEKILSFLPHCEATRWSPLFTDLVPKGISKQIGVDKVMGYFNIPLEETMAFGDGGNDISMLRYVNTGIAMGNADDQVRKSADYVTSTVDEDGIWNTLKHFNII